MFICGMEGAHVDNISYLEKNTDLSYTDMYRVIDRLTPAQRKRYGAGYSKTDFSILQNAVSGYKKPSDAPVRQMVLHKR